MDDLSRRRTARLAVLVLAVLAVAGCSLVFQRPTLEVVRVSLGSLGFSGGRVDVDVHVVNPNGYTLTREELRYRLEYPSVAGMEGDTTWVTLVQEVSRDTVLIAAADTARFTVALPFDFATLGNALGRLLSQGELDYRFSGEIRVRTPVGRVGIPFQDQGTFRP